MLLLSLAWPAGAAPSQARMQRAVLSREKAVIASQKKVSTLAQVPWKVEVEDRLGRLRIAHTKSMGAPPKGLTLSAVLRSARPEQGEPAGHFIVDSEAYLFSKRLTILTYHRERTFKNRIRAEDAYALERLRWDGMSWERFLEELRDLSPESGGGPGVLEARLTP